MNIRKSAYKQVLDFEKAISIFNNVQAYLGENTVNVQAELSRIKRRFSKSLKRDGFDLQSMFGSNKESLTPLTGIPTDDERESAIDFVKRSVDIFTIIKAMEGVVSFACLVDSRLNSEREFRSIRDKFAAVLLSSTLLPAEDKKRVRELHNKLTYCDEPKGNNLEENQDG